MGGRGPRRTPNGAERHLEWFFNDAPAAVSGLRSSWALVDGPGFVGGVPGSKDVPAHRLSAARRESDTASRLEQLAVDDRVVLSLAFSHATPWPVPEEARDRLGARVAPLLPTLPVAQSAYEKVLRRAAAQEDDRELVFDVEAVDGRDAAWRRGIDPRRALDRLVRRGFADWLYSFARTTDHEGMLKDASADARLALRRALEAWATVAPQPDAEGRTRQQGRRRGAMHLELVAPAAGALEMFAPAWEPVAAE